jgi:hypothetical protein
MSDPRDRLVLILTLVVAVVMIAPVLGAVVFTLMGGEVKDASGLQQTITEMAIYTLGIVSGWILGKREKAND